MNNHEAFLAATFGPVSQAQRINRRKIIKSVLKPLLSDKEIVPSLFCLTDRVKNLGGLGAAEVMARIGWWVLELETGNELD